MNKLTFFRRSNVVNSAFTLLELVVVVAILGILSAVAIPSLLGNTEKARMVAAKKAVASAVVECGLAIDQGFTKSELTFPQAGGSLNADLVPTLFARLDGYRFDQAKGGCYAMYLVPDRPNDSGDPDASGYPVIQAKFASKGRIIKAFDKCQSAGNVDLTEECLKWDASGSVGAGVVNCKEQGYRRQSQINECNARNKLQSQIFSSDREDISNPDGSWLLK